MAEKQPTVVQHGNREGTGAITYKWSGVQAGDVCLPVKTTFMPDASLEIDGNLSGASVYLKGSNQVETPDQADLKTLEGYAGTDAIFTTNVLRQIATASNWKAPVLTGGDGNTLVDLYLHCTTSR